MGQGRRFLVPRLFHVKHGAPKAVTATFSFGPQDFQKATGVSRETLERLQIYADLLVKWQARINLIGPRTLPDLWQRHMLDSAQILRLLPPGTRTLVDMGSGAGFPGLVLAICGIPDVHLVESDQRKCAFLREAARLSGVSVTVHNTRIEMIAPFEADILTARALAPVAQLLDLGERFIGPRTLCLFLKGQNVEVELTEAHKMWTMQVDRQPSQSDGAATILRLSEVRREQPA